MFRPQKTSKKTRIKLHGTLVLPALLYGSQILTVTASYEEELHQQRWNIWEKQ